MERSADGLAAGPSWPRCRATRPSGVLPDTDQALADVEVDAEVPAAHLDGDRPAGPSVAALVRERRVPDSIGRAGEAEVRPRP